MCSRDTPVGVQLEDRKKEAIGDQELVASIAGVQCCPALLDQVNCGCNLNPTMTEDEKVPCRCSVMMCLVSAYNALAADTAV